MNRRMFDVATRHCGPICWIPRSHGHPGHPHPRFSPDNTKIAFTMLDEHGRRQVAYVDVTGVQRNWRQMAQGVGGIAAPAWKEGVEAKQAW